MPTQSALNNQSQPQPPAPIHIDFEAVQRATNEINRIAQEAGICRLIPSHQVFLQLNAAGWRCAECGCQHNKRNRMTVRHIIPVRAGHNARHNTANLRVICHRCIEGRRASVGVSEILKTLKDLSAWHGPVVSPLLAQHLAISERTLRFQLQQLEEMGIVRRPRGPRSGWVPVR